MVTCVSLNSINNTREVVIKILTKVLNSSDTALQSNKSNPNWDSLKQLQISLEIEDFFGIQLSDEEAMLITETETLEEATDALLGLCPGVFAITLGKEGTLLGLAGKTYTIPSIPVKPVDTTGAGDAFVGAVLYQLDGLNIQDLDFAAWKKIVENANKAGARTCEYLGAMEAFKNLNNSIFN